MPVSKLWRRGGGLVSISEIAVLSYNIHISISAQNMSSQRTPHWQHQYCYWQATSRSGKSTPSPRSPSNPFSAMEPFLNREPGSSSGPRLPLEDPDRVKKTVGWPLS